MVTKEKTHITLMIDRETHALLKQLAGKGTIAGFIRDITHKLADGIIIDSPIMEKLNEISGKLDNMDLYRKNETGNLEPVKMLGLTAIDSAMIQDVLEKNPDAKQAGFYDLNDSGEWVFNNDRYLEANPGAVVKEPVTWDDILTQAEKVKRLQDELQQNDEKQS